MKPVVEVPPMVFRRMKEVKKKNYRHEAPVEKDIDVEKIVERSLNVEVPIKLREMLAVAPVYRNAYRDKISRKRVPILASSSLAERALVATDMVEENSLPLQVNIASLEDATKTQYKIYTEDGKLMRSWVIQDPLTSYLETLPEDMRSKVVFVGRDAETLRVVPTIINGILREEALLDNGSQIVSMSKEVAKSSQISWDPDSTINMQSANGQIESTCGLARNVPFRLGPITVYLQVHVMDTPAYRVLLGRPFDVITESEIRNDKDGGQTLIVTDPNTRERAVLPTFARGEVATLLKNQSRGTEDNERNFHDTSRNW
jgi:hypothetical protein